MGDALDLTADRRAIRVDRGRVVGDAVVQAHLVIELNRAPSDVVARVDLVGYRRGFGRNAIVRWLYEHTGARPSDVGQRYLHQRAIWMHPRAEAIGSSAG
jgi:hypothetical protein